MAALSLTADASLPSVRLVAAACTAAVRIWQADAADLPTLELVLVEAVTNVARHAYGAHEAGTVTVELVKEKSGMRLAVSDRGRSFDASAIRPLAEPDPSDPSTWPESGIGLAIIRAACLDVGYGSSNGVNTLTMTLPLAKR